MQSLVQQRYIAPGQVVVQPPRLGNPRSCLHLTLLSITASRGCIQPCKSRRPYVRRCKVVCAIYSRSGPRASSRSNSSPPIQRNPSSAVHSLSFNQQLLIVLSIPAAALGIPFALSHPIFCIVIPLIIYYNPSLQAIVKPLFAAFLQLILSGLRPAGSPRSAAFPWQQTSQSTWSSPPIDVEYQALPEASVSTASTQPATANRNTGVQSQVPSTSYQTASPTPTSRPRVAIRTQNSMDRREGAGYRRKVSIRPADSTLARQDRVVRQAAPGQVGVNLRPDSGTGSPKNSTVVRVLLGVFPFLRHWGGFV